ncbi:MAG: MAPEG family protein [Brachymonas sp.]|jgi:uncharacterized MAPEG superfamily protein
MQHPTFTVAMWCLLVAAFLPLLPSIIAKWTGFKQKPAQGGYDNHEPRAWLAKQTGYQARANAAQMNTYEALPFFFTAVLLAHYLNAPQGTLDLLCMVWLILRSAYVMLYVADQAALRSTVWAAAVGLNVWIFVLGYRSY